MKRPGRLSLRARLLVLLVAVTAAFLLVMGGVTTLVLTRRLNTQFNTELVAAAANPFRLAGNSAGFDAVAVVFRPRRLVSLTPGSPGDAQLQKAASQLSVQQFFRVGVLRPFSLTLADGTRVRAVERMVLTARLPGEGLVPGRSLVLVARPLSALTAQAGSLVVTELITGGALLLLLALGGRWLIGRGLAPLSEMAETAHRITAHADLDARMPDADDRTEVGRLGTAVNSMLDQIQQAFGARLRSEQKVRQFAADASHELRTPLTTIRGYAELYRQGALGDGQLPDAMRRIEQEARRMSTLVAELLELARLDRTSSLDLAETDLAELVRDAVADARAVEPGRPIQPQAPGHLLAMVDEARIRQVLANLLGNVREHTPQATAVVVRLAQVAGAVVLEVADEGPGMPANDAAHAFDRFHRGSNGDSANGTRRAGGSAGAGSDGAGPPPTRESGGSGLGLSIVAAIAQAHGGEAMMQSEPGRGTRVAVWLPTAVT